MKTPKLQKLLNKKKEYYSTINNLKNKIEDIGRQIDTEKLRIIGSRMSRYITLKSYLKQKNKYKKEKLYFQVWGSDTDSFKTCSKAYVLLKYPFRGGGEPREVWWARVENRKGQTFDMCVHETQWLYCESKK
ncbi:hypothetical protein LCGC14_1249430 [marine sediment metagenome]|uniref:Uncharacterized protein n=1 Tax=marine sediment metagenome TaxID=412755 RepID=A0A0F9L7D6_9ZZZZ